MKTNNTELNKEFLLANRRTIEFRINDFLSTFENGQYKVDAFTQITSGRGFKKDQLNIAVYLVGEWGVNVYINVDTLELKSAFTQGKYNKEDTKSMLNLVYWLYGWHIEKELKQVVSDIKEEQSKIVEERDNMSINNEQFETIQVSSDNGKTWEYKDVRRDKNEK